MKNPPGKILVKTRFFPGILFDRKYHAALKRESCVSYREKSLTGQEVHTLFYLDGGRIAFIRFYEQISACRVQPY